MAPKQVKIFINVPDGNIKKHITGSFSDDEFDIMKRFEEYADLLAQIELHKEGRPGRLTLNYDIKKGFSYSVSLPPEDQILALLHRLRPFILNDEKTYFYKVCNLLSKNLVDEDFRKYLKSIRNMFSGEIFRSISIIQLNNVIINSEETLKKWLNAYEYHKDLDKQAELDLIHKILPKEASRAIFIMMLYDMSKAIFIISGLIKIFLGKIKTFSCEIK